MDPPVNLSTETVDVRTFGSKYPFPMYRNGQLAKAPLDHPCRNWSLDTEDLKIGIVTLSISSVQLSDGGPIEINIRSLNVLNLTDLIVKKVQEQHGGTNDPSSTAPPESHDVNQDQHGGRNYSNTTSNDHDTKNSFDWTSLGIGVGSVVAVAAVVGLGVFLVKCGVIGKLHRWMKGQEQETELEKTELENLRTKATEVDGDALSAAENGLTQH